MLLVLAVALAQDPAPAVNPLVAVVPERGEVKVLVRGEPAFPAEARRDGVAAGGCTVRIFFDEGGAPYRAVPLQCDEVWVDASVKAALQYRIAPFVKDGVVRRVRYDTAFVFALETKPGVYPTIAAPPAPPPPTPAPTP